MEKTVTIKMQCRDDKGNLLAYHNEVKSLLEQSEIAEKWEEMYGDFIKVIQVNYFYK